VRPLKIRRAQDHCRQQDPILEAQKSTHIQKQKKTTRRKIHRHERNIAMPLATVIERADFIGSTFIRQAGLKKTPASIRRISQRRPTRNQPISPALASSHAN